MPNELPISNGTRIGSMLLDQFIMTMICMVFYIPTMISTFSQAFTVSHEAKDIMATGGPLYFIGLLGFALYFCKDCINGRSIAKRITGLQVIDKATGQIASPMKCFVRNIFCIIWPIEVLVTFANPNRRIGDLVAGTKVVRFDPAQTEQPKFDYRKVLLPYALSFGIIFLLSSGFKSIMPSFKPVPYVESSYNPTESSKLEKLFADSLGQYLTASIKVYDTVANERVKYISVICQLKENYLEDSQNATEMKRIILGYLYTKVDRNNYMGRIQYVYKTSGQMITHWSFIGK